MKKIFILFVIIAFTFVSMGQPPQKLSYQAVIRDASGKLIQNSNVGIRISILQGSASGTVVYTETHALPTNINGLVSLEIGGGVTTGNFSAIDWTNGPYFLKTETDPEGGLNYSITGVSQLLSVPYAIYAGNGFSGDYNDLTNKPITDGSETKIIAGSNISVSGTGTIASPYVISHSAGSSRLVFPSTQTWNVPAGVSKIRVELWGASGGGGGAGCYSYSYYLNNGGNGGSGGYAMKELEVIPGQQMLFTIGTPGDAGVNATYYYPGYWYGDTDGGDGLSSWLYTNSVMEVQAAGGTGGKRGSFDYYTVHGSPGTDNTGTVTAYGDDPANNFLNVFQGIERSYISDRILTSKRGKGGSIISSYSNNIPPGAGEGGCAIITFLE